MTGPSGIRTSFRLPTARSFLPVILLVVALIASSCGSGGESGDGADGATVGSTAAADADAGVETSDEVGAEPDEVEVEVEAAQGGIDCITLCNIVMEGDSLTEGLGERLCLEVATGNCVNSGTSGYRVGQMIESAPSDVDNQVGDGDNDVLILWGGTNDLLQQFHSTDPDENAAATYEQISLYLEQRRAAGWDYTFVLTLPPMNDETVQGRTTLNDLIRANAAGADSIIDVDAEPKLADPFNPELREVDGVHFTALGANVVGADHLVPAIRSLHGS